MIPGSELALILTAVLIGAVVLGWLLHALWARVVHGGAEASRRLSALTEELHDAQMGLDAARKARAEAETARAAAEAAAAAAIARADATAAETEARLTAAWAASWAESEAAWQAEIREARADAGAAMDGLGTARRRILELEAEIARLSQA